jgi:hypothetical protein
VKALATERLVAVIKERRRSDESYRIDFACSIEFRHSHSVVAPLRIGVVEWQLRRAGILAAKRHKLQKKVFERGFSRQASLRLIRARVFLQQAGLSSTILSGLKAGLSNSKEGKSHEFS